MSRSLPPGPRGPSVTQMARLARDPFGVLRQWQARFGDVYTIRLPGFGTQVVVAEPECVKALVTAGYEGLSRNAEPVRFLLGDHSILFQNGAQHKETRKLMTPPFHGERMRAHGDEMARVTDQVIARWRDGERRALFYDMQDISIEVALRTVFGIADAARLRELSELVIEFLNAMMTPWYYAASLLLGGSRLRELLRGRGAAARGLADVSRWPIQGVADRLGAIDAILFDEIARCRRLSTDELARRTDVLALLVASRFEDGSAMSDEVLRDQLMTLLAAGPETTAVELSWTIGNVLRHPTAVEDMRAEVDAVFAGGFDAAKVRQLTYVGAAINEAMRLYPTTYGVPRLLEQDMTLGAWTVPAGTCVVVALGLVQRDARIWPDPDAYHPERFLGGRAPVYQFLPFGAGVWRCLGAQLAEYQMRVVMARVIAQVDLRLPVDAGPLRPMMQGFSIAPHDHMQAYVQRRSKEASPPVAA
jgi:cytochrome P450